MAHPFSLSTVEAGTNRCAGSTDPAENSCTSALICAFAISPSAGQSEIQHDSCRAAMLSRLGNPLLMQEDEGQEQGHQHHEQQQIVPPPPPVMGLGMMPPPGQEEQILLALAASATMGNVGFQTPGILDDDRYFNWMAASTGAQESLFLEPLAQAAGLMTGAGSQMFSLFNMFSSSEPFDLGLSGGGQLASIAGTASNSSSLSLISAGNNGLLGSFGGFGTALPPMPEFGDGLGGFDIFDNGAGSSLAPPLPASAPLTKPFATPRSKAVVVVRPLEISPPVGAQPTLFQKRAIRRNAGEKEDDKKRKTGSSSGGGSGGTLLLDDGDDDGLSVDGSGLNYDSEAEDANGVEDSDKKNMNATANTTVTAAASADDRKGKKKGMPTKNLMAERRRRKKLNDRLYMLRSAVPKITKVRTFVCQLL
jgi:hypothetical protein